MNDGCSSSESKDIALREPTPLPLINLSTIHKGSGHTIIIHHLEPTIFGERKVSVLPINTRVGR